MKQFLVKDKIDIYTNYKVSIIYVYIKLHNNNLMFE